METVYNKVSFNNAWVKTLTEKQFLMRGKIGNDLTDAQLSEVYQLITGKSKENANIVQPIASKSSGELAGTSIASDDTKRFGIPGLTEKAVN